MPAGKAPAPQPALASTSSPPPGDSFYTRLVLTPLLAVSFILSLVLIDRKTNAAIHNHHHADPCGKDCEYYHSHQRKLAKQEMDDAFKLRGRIIAALVTVTGLGLVTAGWGAVKGWGIWMAGKVNGEI